MASKSYSNILSLLPVICWPSLLVFFPPPTPTPTLCLPPLAPSSLPTTFPCVPAASPAIPPGPSPLIKTLSFSSSVTPSLPPPTLSSLAASVTTSSHLRNTTKFPNNSCTPSVALPSSSPRNSTRRFYLGFCKRHLWPLFHYLLPLSPDLAARFNRSLWQA